MGYSSVGGGAGGADRLACFLFQNFNNENARLNLVKDYWNGLVPLASDPAILAKRQSFFEGIPKSEQSKYDNRLDLSERSKAGEAKMQRVVVCDRLAELAKQLSNLDRNKQNTH